MPTTFAVNSNNDLYIGEDGNLVIITGLAALVQITKQAAQTLLGEMVLRVNDGIPYFQSVWSGIPNMQLFKSALQTAILGVDGVTGIESLTTSQSGNVVSYTAVINTVYGQTTING